MFLMKDMVMVVIFGLMVINTKVIDRSYLFIKNIIKVNGRWEDVLGKENLFKLMV